MCIKINEISRNVVSNMETASGPTLVQGFFLFSLFPGSNRYRILPLHSQIPREEQRRVFEPVPDNITKV